MEFLIVPLLIGVMAVPAPLPPAEQLADFTRLAKAVDEEVYIVDSNGQERRVTLLEAGDQAVRFMVGQQTLEMSRDAIVRVDRVRDRNIDGIVKGALIGLLIGGIAEANTSGSEAYWLRGMLAYGGIGYLFDVGHVARQPVYRATVSAKTP
jgi:uncharacterized protein YcfJ